MKDNFVSGSLFGANLCFTLINLVNGSWFGAAFNFCTAIFVWWVRETTRDQ